MLGAFGAHALRGSLSAASLSAYQTGVQYQLVHALALLGVALLVRDSSSALLTATGALLIAGTVCFSGSLYLLTVFSVRAMGPVTPLGGVLLILAWLTLLVAALRLS